jgi:hypothetical protein
MSPLLTQARERFDVYKNAVLGEKNWQELSDGRWYNELDFDVNIVTRKKVNAFLKGYGLPTALIGTTVCKLTCRKKQMFVLLINKELFENVILPTIIRARKGSNPQTKSDINSAG